MPVIQSTQPPAATALQSESQNRLTSATQAPDLKNTLAQGQRAQQSTVVRGSDPVQKTLSSATDNEATRSALQTMHMLNGTETDASGPADENGPVRYSRRLSEASKAKSESDPQYIAQNIANDIIKKQIETLREKVEQMKEQLVELQTRIARARASDNTQQADVLSQMAQETQIAITNIEITLATLASQISAPSAAEKPEASVAVVVEGATHNVAESVDVEA